MKYSFSLIGIMVLFFSLQSICVAADVGGGGDDTGVGGNYYHRDDSHTRTDPGGSSRSSQGAPRLGKRPHDANGDEGGGGFGEGGTSEADCDCGGGSGYGIVQVDADGNIIGGSGGDCDCGMGGGGGWGYFGDPSDPLNFLRNRYWNLFSGYLGWGRNQPTRRPRAKYIPSPYSTKSSFQAKSAPVSINQQFANVDMLMGGLFFSTIDYSLSGRNGLDLEMTRIYNSHVYSLPATADSSAAPGSGSGTAARRGFLGQGWQWQMDRIHGDTMFYTSGGRETMFRDLNDNTRRKNRRYEIISDSDVEDPDTLWRQEGTRVIFDDYYTFQDASINNAFGGKYVTKIVDACSNELKVFYCDNVPLVDSVVDAGGRKFWFEYSSTDSTDLLDTRLLKLNFRTYDNDTLFIEYVYDDSLDDDWEDYNPLVMVVYPNADTTRYTYADSVLFNSTYYQYDALWLTKITLPFGGKYHYDWRIYREQQLSPGSDYMWHVNVNRIRKEYTDSSVDTTTFTYDYSVELSGYPHVISTVAYPDNTLRLYRHTRVRPRPIDYEDQDSGLLDRIAYFNDASDTTNSLVYSWFAWDEDGGLTFYCYPTHSIGTDIESPHDSITVPVLARYAVAYGRAPRAIKYFDSNAGWGDIFNVHTGLFPELTENSKVKYRYRTHIDSTNLVILDSTLVIHNGDSLSTVNFWDTSKMKIDSIKVTIKGETRQTKFVYDSYGNMTKEVTPLADTTQFEYSSSLNYCYLTKVSNHYGDLWKADYYLNTGRLEHWVSANSDTTFYYYDDYGRPNKTKRPLETGYSLTRSYNRATKSITDSTKMSSSLNYVQTNYYDGFNRFERMKILDETHDSIMVEIEYDCYDRIKRKTRAYASLSDTAWTTVDYDILGRTIKTAYPDATRDSVFYDSDSTSSASWTDKYFDPIDRNITKIFNSKNELLKIMSDTLSQDTVYYEYGGFSRVTQITDPRGLITKYKYDNFGNVTWDSTVDEGVRRFYFDSRDRMRFIKNNAGDWSYRKYDLMGRLLETGIKSAIDTTYMDSLSYPSSGHTVQVTYKYDEYEVSFSFVDSTINNPKGNLAIVNDEASKTWFYYDDRNRLALRMVYIDGMSDTLRTWYDHGDADQIEKITYPDSTQISYTYYKSMRLKDYFVGAPGIHTDDQFKYNAWGGLEKINIDGDTTYFVDYEYDDMSMPTSIFAKKDSTGLWGRSYGYDNAHMIDLVKLLDDSGSPTNDTTKTYIYDYLYRLTEADLVQAGKTVKFGYDKSGNRKYKKVDADSTHYILADSLIIDVEFDTIQLMVDGTPFEDFEYFTPVLDTIFWECDVVGSSVGRFRILNGDSTYVDIDSMDQDSSGYFIPISTSEFITRLNWYSGGPRITAETRYTLSSDTTIIFKSNKLDHLDNQDPGNFVYNDNGCVVYDSSKGMEYFFDEGNRLDSIRVGDYKRYVYSYDAAGRRVKKLFIEGIFCDSTEWSIDNHNDECEHDTGTCWFVPGDVDGD
ncbi:MAG: hypothetical protein V3W18_03825, partial [candidate division Zixibacteria bacterium]